MDQAYVILWMIDSTDTQRRFEELKADILPHCEGKKMIILFNKSDLLLATQKEELSAIFADMKVENYLSQQRKGKYNDSGKEVSTGSCLTGSQPKRYYHYKCTPLRSINTSIGFYS